MMLLDFKDFLIHSGMREDDPCAIPEYEIMAQIARLLPASTTVKVLVRFWKRAFAQQPEKVRRSVYRVRQGCDPEEPRGQTLHFCPYDFIVFSHMDRADESWFKEYTIMRRIAAMVPASTPTAAVRALWRQSFQRAPLSQREGIRIRRPTPDIYGPRVQPTTSGL